MLKVTVWNEGRFDKTNEEVKKVYPEGIHNQIKNILSQHDELFIRTATLDDESCGLPDSVLDDTDVLIWWAHSFSADVPDELAEKVAKRVHKGMGFIALHSAHLSKPFMRLMGTSCTLKWREGDRERLWCCNPSHPIAEGIPEYIDIPLEEMYGEPFDIPEPDELVFIGWFAGGQVFRSGCAYKRGYGKVFYFQPGHEAYPIYYNDNIIKILYNAVKWAAPKTYRKDLDCPLGPDLEK